MALLALLAPYSAPRSCRGISWVASCRGTSWVATQVFKAGYLHTGTEGWTNRIKNAQITWKCTVEQDASLATSGEELSGRVMSETSEDDELGEVAEEEEEEPDGWVVDGADVNSILEWQLDFCSRPIFDDRGKRIWELIVCDAKRQFEFARFFPSNVINSTTLKGAIAEIIQTLGLPKPVKVRFFRSQVKTIITKACKELDIEPVPSLRCTTLIRWLQERYDQVYSQDPGFQEGASAVSVPDVNLPQPVPDNMKGEKWAFVQLPFEALQQEMKLVEEGTTFGNVSIDITDIPSPDALIPGVAVASSRAVPLAAWTNSMELASIDVDKVKSCLVLSTGASQKYFYAFYSKGKQADAEADAWEEAKQACGGLHFLAIQPKLESDSLSGLWLLYDFPTSPV